MVDKKKEKDYLYIDEYIPDYKIDTMSLMELQKELYRRWLKQLNVSRRIDPSDTVDNDLVMQDAEGRLKVNRNVQPVAMTDLAGGVLLPSSAMRTVQDAPSTNDEAYVPKLYQVNASDYGIWMVYAIIAGFKASADVAARTFNVESVHYGAYTHAVGVNEGFKTASINLTAGEEGFIAILGNKVHYTNDNGTHAIVTDEVSMPMILGYGESPGYAFHDHITTMQTGKHANDRMTIRVYYIRVG